MKILYLSSLGQLGGAERSLLDLLWSLRRHAPALDLELLSLGEGPLIDAAEALGVPSDVIALPEEASALGDWSFGVRTIAQLLGLLPRVPTLAGFVRRLHRRVANAQADVLHSNGPKAHILGALLTGKDRRLVWHVRDFLSQRPLLRMALPHLQRPHLSAIAISDAVASDTRRVLGRTRVHRVLNGVRTAEFASAATKPADLDRLAGLPPAPAGTVRIGLVATYAQWKGHDLFLDAAARIAGGPVRFYVVGGPLYATRDTQVTPEYLRARIIARGLEGRVGLVQFQADVPSTLAALDVVVQASTRPEPFGRTVAEAMAAGRAVVAPAAGGILEQAADGETAIFYPPGDAGALGKALQSLASDGRRRSTLGAEAQVHARRALDAERLGPEILEVYRQELQEP